MKLKLFVAALIVAFALPAIADASSNESGGSIQVAQKKKQKGKPKAATATAGAAVGAAATAAIAEPAKAEPLPSAAAPTSADAAKAVEAPKPTVGGNVVKTDLYTVVDGVKVDAKTLDGFKIWRAAACDRCHGANQEGLVGPSLLESIRKLTKDEFVTTMKDGRLEKGMPAWSINEQVMKGMDNLYAYLKGRADGAITKAKVTAME